MNYKATVKSCELLRRAVRKSKILLTVALRAVSNYQVVITYILITKNHH